MSGEGFSEFGKQWSVVLEENVPYPPREPQFYGTEQEARAFFDEEVKRQCALDDSITKFVLLVNPEGNSIMQCACREIIAQKVEE